MKRKALIVTVDDDVMTTIEDTLDSLGHEFDRARSKREAFRLATINQYAYVLLDIEIPANRRQARPERVHGYHLLEELHSAGVSNETLVIIMDGQTQCLDYVPDYLKKGAEGFAGKNPTDSHRLAKVIRRILKSPRRHQHSGSRPMPFRGGKLSIHSDRAELLGIRIMTDSGYGHSLRILRLLARRRKGRFVAMSLAELVEAGRMDSQSTVTGSIRKLRQNCSDRLRKALNLDCGKEDVLIRDEQGYQLAPWIDVEFVDEEEVEPDVTARVTADVTGDTPDVPAVVPELSLNNRQRWALTRIRQGIQLQRCMIEAQFNVSDRTAKRDLLELRQAGLITWVRAGSTGHYRLAVPPEPAA